MCGIAGYLGRRPPQPEAVERTLALMRPRGPDRQAAARIACQDQTAVLLHARLRILDLDPRADQPMARRGRTLVFNGEIYNYRELRDGRLAGCRWSTESDTEVILEAFERDGLSCFESFEGMWALALLDPQRRRLVLSRDRFGEKPLYLLRTAEGVYFGSEVKYLFSLSGATPQVNTRHLLRLLVNGYKSLYKTREQYFTGVEALEPGTTLCLDYTLKESRQRYWTPRVQPAPTTLPEAAAALRERLTHALALRLRADVPVAFCLSGGVDSAGLASLAAKTLGARVATFSILDRDPRYDESVNIRRTVADLGCPHTGIEIPRDGALERLERLIEYRWAPLSTLSYYVHSLLSEAIAGAGFRVALSGTGADELFTGYFDHFNLHLYAMRGRPELASLRAAWEAHVRPIVRNPGLQRPDLYEQAPNSREHVYLNRDQFAAATTHGFDEPFTEERYCDCPLRNRMLNELLHETVPPILHEDDANSMRVSVENRSPYLDTGLFELAYSLPIELLIRDGYAKLPLRQALAGVLNEPVRTDRRKVGFNAAFRSVFDAGCPATRARLLADSPVFGLVRRESIEFMLEMDPLPNSFSKFLFSFVNVKLFLERFAPQGLDALQTGGTACPSAELEAAAS